MTWVPDVLQSPEFSLEGLGLEYNEDLWLPFRKEIQEFLQRSPSNVVVTQTRPVTSEVTTEWIRESPPGLKRFAVKCSDAQSARASWEHYAGLQAPVSEDEIELLIDEAFPFAQQYVFTSLFGDSGLPDWLEESEMAELASRTQALAVDLFDGSGVLFWQRR